MTADKLILGLNAQVKRLTQQLGREGRAICHSELTSLNAALASGDKNRVQQALTAIVQHNVEQIHTLSAQTHGGIDFHFFSPEKHQVIDCAYKEQLAETAKTMLEVLDKKAEFKQKA